MDSSRSQSLIPAEVAIGGFLPWQIDRLKDRLANYKSAVRHGWERIALDILDSDGQDPDYVDKEDVRSFSESLRRLAAGTQEPKDERLKALFIYLAGAGYISASDLEDKSEGLQVPIAFNAFMTGEEEKSGKGIERLGNLTGSYSNMTHGGLPLSSGEYLTHTCLRLSLNGEALVAKLSCAVLKRADTAKRLKSDASLRKRALVQEMIYDGFALVTPDQRIVIFSRPSAYSELYQADVKLIWALPGNTLEGGVNEGPAESILIMEYSDVSLAEDIPEAGEFLNGKSETGPLFLSAPKFSAYERD